MDRFSPVAPAHVRVLVLPVGRIERAQFLQFLHRLQKDACQIPLASLKIENNDRLSSLAPSAAPHGSILFNFTTAAPDEHHQQLPPFELFREPLLVLGVTANLTNTPEDTKKELGKAAEYLRDRHPRVVHRQVIVLSEDGCDSQSLHHEAIHIPNTALNSGDSIEGPIQTLTVRFLIELATYMKAMQASPTIQTPMQASRTPQAKSLREKDRRSGSGSGQQTTPTTDVSSPISDDGSSRPPSRGMASPPGTISGHMQVKSGGLTRSDSRTSNTSQSGNASSNPDRISIQGFGSNTSQEKGRNRGKARVGIVLGHIHLMAGQWEEALRMLNEHTNKSRTLSDHIWHAKGLEGIMVCLLLHAWAGLDFQVPPLFSSASDRVTSMAAQRLPVNPSNDAHSAETARLESLQKLAKILPDMVKQILNMYRSGDGGLDLPSLVVSEATLRFCKLLAVLHRGNGDLKDEGLSRIVLDRFKQASQSKRRNEIVGPRSTSQGAVADILGQVNPILDEGLSTADQISILAGTASIYSLLQMSRKRAITTKHLIIQLTAALTQARKLGAAEMGIHPSASLSAETGAGAILAVVEESGGINELISQIVQIYGAELVPTSQGMSSVFVDQPEKLNSNIHFGNTALKADILKDMVAFCEASPDPYGVLRLTASLLKVARTPGAVDIEAERSNAAIRNDEHARLAAVISRTIGVSKALGLPDVQTAYWDPFLVRGVEFRSNTANPKVIERSKLKATVAGADQRTPGNPLLYDPNTSRPGTAVTPEKHILVENELSECIVALQNPFEMALEVESLILVTEGAELVTEVKSFTLGPRIIQKVPISITPSSIGETRVTGCRVKMFGCHEQVFPVVQKPWRDTSSSLVKDHGQISWMSKPTKKEFGTSQPEYTTVVATVIAKQPVLTIKSVSVLESSLMMLEGERQSFQITVRNESNVPALIFDSAGTREVFSFAEDLTSPVTIPCGETGDFKIQAIGKAGVSNAQADFYYCSALDDGNASEYVRTLSTPLSVTVNAALRLQHFDILPTDSSESFILLFDLGNAWPAALEYDCAVEQDASLNNSETNVPHEKGKLGPGELVRIQLPVRRWESFVDYTSPENTAIEFARHLRVFWTCDDRRGEMTVANMNLNPQATSILQGSPVQVTLSTLDTLSSGHPNQLSVNTGSFITVRACLTNRRAATGSGPLFVQLHTKKADGSSYNDRHVAAAGALHRLIPPLAISEEKIVEFVICPLMAGKVDLRATVAPVLQSGTKSIAWLGTDNLMIDVE